MGDITTVIENDHGKTPVFYMNRVHQLFMKLM